MYVDASLAIAWFGNYFVSPIPKGTAHLDLKEKQKKKKLVRGYNASLCSGPPFMQIHVQVK